ncbi:MULTISPECIES: hypothetical protein [unclassified Inquilinus]|uniref:hypothetical protein n=1 Tax=unclassified Inquilinus TaxID=2645927 RepID=UPI003F93504B
MTTIIRDIPLSKLVPSAHNARRTGRESGIEELAASISTLRARRLPMLPSRTSGRGRSAAPAFMQVTPYRWIIRTCGHAIGSISGSSPLQTFTGVPNSSGPDSPGDRSVPEGGHWSGRPLQLSVGLNDILGQFRVEIRAIGRS